MTRRLYLILAVLVVALLVAIPLLAQAEAEPEPACTLFLPLVNQPCEGFLYSCPMETWPACDCPWCLAGVKYCVKWDPNGDMVPVE
jgi:hypothetical protein